MKKIIEPGIVQSMITTCYNCHCKFSYDNCDVREKLTLTRGDYVVDCPQCGAEVSHIYKTCYTNATLTHWFKEIEEECIE